MEKTRSAVSKNAGHFQKGADMQEIFENIKERVCEFIHERNKSGSAPCKNQRASCLQLIRVCDLTAIVNQVAEEYSEVGNDEWISLPRVAFNRMIARMENESERDIYDEESMFINVKDAARIIWEILNDYCENINVENIDEKGR